MLVDESFLTLAQAGRFSEFKVALMEPNEAPQKPEINLHLHGHQAACQKIPYSVQSLAEEKMAWMAKAWRPQWMALNC